MELKTKLNIFLAVVAVLILAQLKLLFFFCNKLGFKFSTAGILFLLGGIALLVGYALRKYWGFIVGLGLFSLSFTVIFVQYIQQLIFVLSIPGVLILNYHGILLTAFVYGVFILYIISTRNYFKDQKPVETTFHKVMFVLLFFALAGSLFITYQTNQLMLITCLQEYTFSEEERFATQENALITDIEAYYNRDFELFFDSAYHSDGFKEKLSKANISFEQFKAMSRQSLASARVFDKVDRIEITSKKTISENEVYLQYRIYFKKLEGYAQTAPKGDFAYMIKVNNRWKVNG